MIVIEFSAGRRAAEASDRGDNVPTTVSVFLSDWAVRLEAYGSKAGTGGNIGQIKR